jgi:hypothetical protein
MGKVYPMQRCMMETPSQRNTEVGTLSSSGNDKYLKYNQLRHKMPGTQGVKLMIYTALTDGHRSYVPLWLHGGVGANLHKMRLQRPKFMACCEEQKYRMLAQCSKVRTRIDCRLLDDIEHICKLNK